MADKRPGPSNPGPRCATAPPGYVADSGAFRSARSTGQWPGLLPGLLAAALALGQIPGVLVAMGAEPMNGSLPAAVTPGGSGEVASESGDVGNEEFVGPSGVAVPETASDFGASVAVSGDTMVVGAPFYSLAANGVVFVYVRSEPEDAWSLQGVLTAADASPDDYFGSSVDVWGDTVVVGAPGYALERGAVYVFARAGGVWSQESKLLASDGRGCPCPSAMAIADQFGSAVAIWGDTVIAGAGTSDFYTGAAYIFSRSGSSWSEQRLDPDPLPCCFAGFGVSVDVWGGTVIVGAPGLGSAFVFVRSGDVWVQEQKLPAGAGEHLFGLAVGLVGDTAVVGAPFDDSQTGAAYVFTRSSGVWSQSQKLLASDGSADDGFGYSVGLSGERMVIGAPRDDDGVGADYVFALSGDAWAEQDKIVVGGASTGDQWGRDVVVWDGVAVVATNLAGEGVHTFSVDTPRFVRYAGSNRYGTAAAVAGGVFPAGATTVFVATGSDFPDAVAGAAVAGKLGAPVLLVSPSGVPAETLAELTRLQPDQIVILGGLAVIGAGIEATLGSYASSVVRLAGPNRYATAAAISQFGFPGTSSEVVVVAGTGFADALAAGPAAVAWDAPVLLTEPGGLPQVIADEIVRLSPSRIVVVGGATAVSETVFGQLQALQANTVRIAGPNRYTTSAAVSEAAFGSADFVFTATGLDFVDALAGSAAAGWLQVPILLVQRSAVPPAVQNEIFRLGATEIYVLGGTAVITNQVVAILGSVLGL